MPRAHCMLSLSLLHRATANKHAVAEHRASIEIFSLWVTSFL
jgi:hypothetical protein